MDGGRTPEVLATFRPRRLTRRRALLKGTGALVLALLLTVGEPLWVLPIVAGALLAVFALPMAVFLYPKCVVTDGTMIVRNPRSTTTIPLAAITRIDADHMFLLGDVIVICTRGEETKIWALRSARNGYVFAVDDRVWFQNERARLQKAIAHAIKSS